MRRSADVREFDVAIVGAGAAGAIAARALARAGRTVVVLEASERVGGRMRNVDDPRALGPIELGPEFVHGRPAVTYDLMREFGGTVVEGAGSAFVHRGGALEAADDDPFDAATELLSKALDRDADESIDDLLARVARSPEARDARTWTRRLVSGFDAADPARASARAIALEWTGDASADGSQSRPLGGYGPLVAHLARSLGRDRVTLRCATRARRIVRDPGGVTIDAIERGLPRSFRARRAIVAVPHGVLRAPAGADGALAFEPPLPAATLAAIASIEMGPVHKIVLRFSHPFWETLCDGAFRDGAFFNGDGAFPTLWTQFPVRGNTLTAWAGGPAADALAGMPADERTRTALACAGRYFGDPAATDAAFEAAYAHDWQSDPLYRGAYSYALVGGENARAALAAPVDGRLWFAGEATASAGEGGTVAGALESGLRAARAILG